MGAISSGGGGSPAIDPPVVEGTATSQQNSNIQMHPITLPSSIAVGELLVVIFSHHGPSVFGGITINTGVSGVNWNTIAQQAHSGAGFTTAAYWKIAEGSDALRLSTGASARTSVAISMRISGADDVSNAYAEGSSSNPNPPTLDTGAEDDYLWLAIAATDDVTPSVGPPSYTDLLTHKETGNNTSIAIAQRALRIDEENPGSFTAASDDWIARTLAIHPT